MDLFATLSGMMTTSLKARFKELVDTKKIDLSNFANEDKYHIAARQCMGALSNSLTNVDKSHLTYLDISVFSFLLFSLESETPAEVIETGLGLTQGDESTEAAAPASNPLGGGQTVCGAWGGTPVSLADADQALRGDQAHTPDRFDGHRQEDIGMYTAEGIKPVKPADQFDQE
jgi:hypothetical protein